MVKLITIVITTFAGSWLPLQVRLFLKMLIWVEKKIISEYGQVVRFNKIKAAIKLQFRDVDNFIHESYKNLDERYIKKTWIQ